MSVSEEALKRVLHAHLSGLMAGSVLQAALSRSRVRLGALRPGDSQRLVCELERAVRLFIQDTRTASACLAALRELVSGESAPAARPTGCPHAHRLCVKDESDIVKARALGRELCTAAGCTTAGQVRFTTVVSELARNIVQYAGQGEMTLSCQPVSGGVQVEVCARDDGPGISNLDEILEGRYRSRRGLGQGLRGSRQIMDEFDIQSRPGQGTQVTARMLAR